MSHYLGMPTGSRLAFAHIRSFMLWYVITPMRVYSPQPVTYGKKSFVRPEDRSIR
jgi:hypothetical protein